MQESLLTYRRVIRRQEEYVGKRMIVMHVEEKRRDKKSEADVAGQFGE